jgi:hypothetical protein
VRRALVVLALLVAPLAAATAQSSQFGVRGLGAPGRALSTRAFSAGGAFGLFDGESGLNPAALGRVSALGADFTSLQDFRHVENPAGSASVREARFPFISIVGPVKRYPAVLGLSFANYTSRDFTLATVDTLPLRDVPVAVFDTLSSRGSLSDLRAAGAYRIHDDWLIGVGFHVITGSARMRFHRVFADSTNYQSLNQGSELSYAGVGLDLGLIRNFGPGFSLAATVRSDGHVNVDKDSLRAGTINLPYSFGFGLRWRARPKLELASQVLMHTWSGANNDLLAQGGLGSDNNYEASFGLEYTPNLRRPARRPLRLGVRYGTLPFLIDAGEQPKEFGISAGTGIRFAQERAGVDLGLEHVWRSAGAFKERTFLLNLGVTVRP